MTNAFFFEDNKLSNSFGSRCSIVLILCTILIITYDPPKSMIQAATLRSSQKRHTKVIDSEYPRAVIAIRLSIIDRYLAASIVVSIFYTTLFFPWTIDLYGGYFEPPDTIRTEQFFVQLLIPVVLPVAMPLSMVSALEGGLVTTSMVLS